MNGANTTFPKSTENEFGGISPSPEFLPFLERELKQTEDIHAQLKSDYAASVYERFERDFIQMRKRFKDKLQLHSDADSVFLTHSEMRKQATEHILNCATIVAERFQEARENNRLDRPKTTDALENLINAIKNLRTLSEKAVKE